MANLKESLLKTLRGVSEDFDAALAELQAVVAETNDAVRAADKRLSAQLVEFERDTTGVTYVLVIASKRSNQRALYFKLSPNGFPIFSAASVVALGMESRMGRGESYRSMGDSAELRKCFQQMTSHRDSPLVTAITYMMKTAEPAK